METNLLLIKALATTLLLEIDSWNKNNPGLTTGEQLDLNESMREYEVRLIKTALIKAGGNQRRAANLLRIKPTTLHNKIKSLNIEHLKLTVE